MPEQHARARPVLGRGAPGLHGEVAGIAQGVEPDARDALVVTAGSSGIGPGPWKHPRAAAPVRDPQPVRHRSPE
ncbi:hypothetical protein OG936_23780 [Streptomyces sp. NBC_00846]|uniref:hypothetical protein n=1 Tax=Streptomyces sp. NBC_00846 TaxID=2975849 RepID=UPI00386DED68|nr:hypothetical protein OG936_23780 [Streptomyces sp. NBC_00846]